MENRTDKRLVYWRLEASQNPPKWASRDDVIGWLDTWLEWAYEAAMGGSDPMAAKNINKVAWKGFTDIPLTADSLQNFLEWEYSLEELAERVETMMYDGYKFGISYDKQSGTIQCAVTAREPGDPNAGYTFVAVAPDWQAALALATWKHIEVANKDWRAGFAGQAGVYK